MRAIKMRIAEFALREKKQEQKLLGRKKGHATSRVVARTRAQPIKVKDVTVDFRTGGRSVIYVPGHTRELVLGLLSKAGCEGPFILYSNSQPFSADTHSNGEISVAKCDLSSRAILIITQPGGKERRLWWLRVPRRYEPIDLFEQLRLANFGHDLGQPTLTEPQDTDTRGIPTPHANATHTGARMQQTRQGEKKTPLKPPGERSPKVVVLKPFVGKEWGGLAKLRRALGKELEQVEEKIGIRFHNRNLLRQAFVHRSYLNENPEFDLYHNERLEFLGDAVLELIVTEHLFSEFPLPEGALTDLRSALVRGQTLTNVARSLGMNDYLYLSEGEEQSTGKPRELILASALEALIGAIYLDQGYEATRQFIEQRLLVYLPVIIERELHFNHKGTYQQLVQEKTGITPTYKTLTMSGPEHARNLTVGVFVGKKQIAIGAGSSKQAAEQEAAKVALERFYSAPTTLKGEPPDQKL